MNIKFFVLLIGTFLFNFSCVSISERLISEDNSVRSKAIEKFKSLEEYTIQDNGHLGPNPDFYDVLSSLINYLKDEDPQKRERSKEAIISRSYDIWTYVKMIDKMAMILNDEDIDKEIKKLIITTIKKIKIEKREDRDYLDKAEDTCNNLEFAMVKSPCPYTCIGYAYAAINIINTFNIKIDYRYDDHKYKDFIETIVKLKNYEEDTYIFEEMSQLILFFIKSFPHTDGEYRIYNYQEFIKILGDVGKIKPTDEIVLKLIHSLDGSYGIGDEAYRSLAKIGPSVIPMLIKTLKEKKEKTFSGDPKIIVKIIKLLGEFGPLAKDSVPVLMKILEDDEELKRIRDVVAEVLPKIVEKPSTEILSAVERYKRKREEEDLENEIIGLARSLQQYKFQIESLGVHIGKYSWYYNAWPAAKQQLYELGKSLGQEFGKAFKDFSEKVGIYKKNTE